MKVNYRKLTIWAAVLAFGAVLSVSAVGQSDAAATYKGKCAMCHGADGSGNTAVGKKLGVKSFSDPEVAKNSDAVWVEITKNGKGKMPGYAKQLSDQQIKDLVKYIRGLAKEK